LHYLIIIYHRYISSEGPEVHIIRNQVCKTKVLKAKVLGLDLVCLICMARPGFVLAAGDLATIRESVSVMNVLNGFDHNENATFLRN